VKFDDSDFKFRISSKFEPRKHIDLYNICGVTLSQPYSRVRISKQEWQARYEDTLFRSWICSSNMPRWYMVHRFGTSRLLHMKILSSAHLQRRGLGQDAKNWQDLWDALEGSIQCETSECRRGTFYFNIHLNIYQLRFLSKHDAAKVQDPEVVVQTPFWSLCAITHHNLSLHPSTLMAASSCYSASSASYIHLNGPKKCTNKSTSESAMSDALKRFNHIMFTFYAMLPLFAPNTSKMTSNVT